MSPLCRSLPLLLATAFLAVAAAVSPSPCVGPIPVVGPCAQQINAANALYCASGYSAQFQADFAAIVADPTCGFSYTAPSPYHTATPSPSAGPSSPASITPWPTPQPCLALAGVYAATQTLADYQAYMACVFPPSATPIVMPTPSPSATPIVVPTPSPSATPIVVDILYSSSTSTVETLTSDAKLYIILTSCAVMGCLIGILLNWWRSGCHSCRSSNNPLLPVTRKTTVEKVEKAEMVAVLPDPHIRTVEFRNQAV